MIKRIFLLLIILASYLIAQDINIGDVVVKYWHNELAKYLDIEDERLKLAPEYMLVDNSSYSLWNTFNAVTNQNSSIYYNTSQYNNFSSAFRMVLNNSPISSSIDENCDLNKAMLKYIDVNGTYIWDKTIDNLYSALAYSKPMVLKSISNISFDNNITSYTMKVEVSYEHLLIFYSYPYSKYDKNITSYQPWYTHCIMKNSYNDRLNKHWKATFGVNGYLQNISVALVIAQNGSKCISISNNSTVDDTDSYSSCTKSTTPFIMGVIVLSIEDFIK